MTYPDPAVLRAIEERFIPVQFNIVEQPDVMDRFNAAWTPALIVVDADGREHRRSEGYLDPKRFLGEMALARLKAALNRHNFEAARTLASEALARTRADPWREPEAIYWASVAGYKATNDPKYLVEGWNRLLDKFPQSEWAQRASFIRD